MDIDQKLAALHEKYPDEESQTELREWGKRLKKSALYLDLRNHAAFKIICEAYYDELKKINKALQDNIEIFQTEEGRHLGLELHYRKKYIKDFFRPFEIAKAENAAMVDKINKSLQEDDQIT